MDRKREREKEMCIIHGERFHAQIAITGVRESVCVCERKRKI